MGHSGDFEFTIRYNQCTEIAGNFGQETIQGISFEIFLMEYRIVNIWNPDLDIQHPPVFVSVRLLTNNIEASINNHEVLCEWIREKHARGAKREPGK